MNNLIKSGKLFLFLGCGLFFIDSIIMIAGLGRFGFDLLYGGLAAMILSVIMFVFAFFSKKHVAFDIVFIVLACIAFFVMALVITRYEKSDLRPIALTVGILCYVEGAFSLIGVVLAVSYIKKGYADSESRSYRSGGGFMRFLRRVGSAIGGFFAAIGRGIGGLFVRKNKASSHYGYHSYSSHGNKLKELLDSDLFRTLFAVFLAVGSIIYCAVSLSMHFIWPDILTGIPIALVLATVGNVLLTVKNEYLSDVDDYEGISKNILALLLIILYHVLFVLATLTSFSVFNHYARSDGEMPSPFVAALNLSFGVIAIAQPFIYDRLEDNDREWLTVFGFIFFYAALYLVNIGICCLEIYALNSNDMIVSRIVAGVVGGATLIFGIIRSIISIKNIVVSAGRAVVDKATPQWVIEQRQMEVDFKKQERKDNPQFFKCVRKIKTRFAEAARELINTSVDVTVYTNEKKSYGSDYDEIKVTLRAAISRHLPSDYGSEMKNNIKKKYHDELFKCLESLVPDIKAETGYTGKVSFKLIVA